MIYSSVSGAVVAAMAAGEKGSAKAQAWQKLYKSAEEEVDAWHHSEGSR